jgi:thiol:disulfide interchange protein DsbD
MALAVAALLVVGAAAAAPARTPPRSEPAAPKVRVELVSESAAIQPGGVIWVGLRQRIRPGWHTYWTNPGDSGEPASIDWKLPPGFEAGPLEWPHPERIPVGPLMSFGYSGEVVLLARISAPPDLAPGSQVTLAGQASWLVCEKVCIPEEASVALKLPVTSGPAPPDPRGAALVARARTAVPTPSPWAASFSATPEGLALSIAAPGLSAEGIAHAWFYPAQWGAVDHAAPQELRVDTGGLTLQLARGPLPDALASPIEGVLVLGERLDGRTASHAFTLRALPRTAAPSAAASGPSLSVLEALALALAGGLVLNLMPCVLPVLSVKALSLVEQAGEGGAALRRHGLAYTAGVLVSFGAVAGALLALRAGGEEIGWGFQLQSPLFVTLLAYLLFALGLSLSGALLIGARLAGIGHGLASGPGYRGSFFAGALASVAATPCTAPFMGAAVGFAVTQPWAVALAVFEALGLGLALPYLGLTLVPAWRRFLPRPGRWMERLGQFLAFPLYGSVAWLVWVVSQQAGPQGVAIVLAGLVLIGFAAWLHSVARGIAAPWRRAVTAAAALAVIGAIGLGTVAGGASAPTAPAPTPGAAGLVSETFSPGRLAELRARGTPVFVNFTAAWCITCLVNERVALRSPEVAAAFARKGVVYLKADWTRRDGQIAAVLASFGRNGVPLYVLYPAGAAGGEPTVLPQILSEGTIIEAIGKI